MLSEGECGLFRLYAIPVHSALFFYLLITPLGILGLLPLCTSDYDSFFIYLVVDDLFCLSSGFLHQQLVFK